MKTQEHAIILSSKDDENHNGISFTGAGGNAILEFRDNGKVLVNGREVTNDMEIVAQLKEWLSMALADKGTAHLASRMEMRVRELQVLIGTQRTPDSVFEEVSSKRPVERTAVGGWTLRAIAARYFMQCHTNRTVADAQGRADEVATWRREAEEVGRTLFAP